MLARFNSPSTELDQPRGQTAGVYISMPKNATSCPPLRGKTHTFISLMVMFYPLSKPALILYCIIEVLLSEDLPFSAYIGKVSQKANSKLGFLSKNLKGCPERLKELAYLTLVKPSLK